jgi:hypothetical protein
MTDHQLSTRDLAARSNSNESADSLETEQAAATGDQGSGYQNSQADASLTRDPDAGQPAETRVAGSGTDPAAERGELHGSGPGETRAHGASSVGSDQEPLFPSDQSERFTTRWQEIQTSFVDRPRDAVADADTLVADLMQRLAASFSQERGRLEAQWDRGDDVSTEDLRVALTRYRSFFDRLLSA